MTLVQHQTEGDCPTFDQHEPFIKIEDTGHETSPASGKRPVQRSDHSTAVATYFQVLGAFYNMVPAVSTTDIGTALIQCESLVKVAGDLDCVHLLRPHLGNVLGQYRQKLFVAIKADPPRWILLAMALENVSIYTECLIHLAGAHPNWPWQTKRTVLHHGLQLLIKNKSSALDKTCVEAERDLLLATIKIHDNPVEASDLENSDTWLPVQVFRDALARQIYSMGNNSKKAKNRGTFYRGIWKASYMETEEVRGTCQDIYKSKYKDLGDDLKQLKAYASGVVEELAENQLMIDPDAHKVGYLTCIKVEPQDIPWQGEGRSGGWWVQ